MSHFAPSCASCGQPTVAMLSPSPDGNPRVDYCVPCRLRVQHVEAAVHRFARAATQVEAGIAQEVGARSTP